MQNAPSRSGNYTNTTSTYTYDENNVVYRNLSINEEGSSYICYNGTGDTCGYMLPPYKYYNAQVTLLRENQPGQRIEPIPVGQAYNMHVSAKEYSEITSDAGSGFTTQSKTW